MGAVRGSCQQTLPGGLFHINSNVYTCADSIACIQLWSLHEQCHQLSGWGVVSLLYLLACALQYRYLKNISICLTAADSYVSTVQTRLTEGHWVSLP
jgi:hypothetical protein